ncbi:gliding motility lipoprotein GldD [Mucilaginibacter psychrotolerans]|uniref:Gliding motility lipoprotein GldD n=1 Tax=Mucilaginibacter psychrotolerans TaxID=1524096 RepID=A0A4Y8SCZ7_9SPHI|nr:gliding motility lipoprotein GldD [Mucilaginibacter psychrotolerans]TFF36505.1 gliding motility lipoprotein GldD [Mucilaginibacter psychrotolerans]
MKKAAFSLIILVISACGGQPDYSPKPRGYFRIVYPKKEYQAYTEGCPFTFDYPKYSSIEPDKSRGAMPCWQNIQFTQFNATLHLSYQPVTSQKEFNELIEDAHKLSFKHTVKATSIDEGVIAYPAKKVYGIYYTIDGNAASSAQFFLTDSTKHYLRGALYFNSEPRLDSIQPVLDFLKKDVDVMIKTFKWKQ